MADERDEQRDGRAVDGRSAGDGGRVERDGGGPVVVEERVFLALGDEAGEVGGEEREVGCEREERERVGEWGGEDEDLVVWAEVLARGDRWLWIGVSSRGVLGCQRLAIEQ